MDQYFIGLIVSVSFGLIAYFMRLISISGLIGGVIFGTIIYAATDWRGFAIPLAFFIIGNLCTKHGYQKKAALGIAQEEGGKRGAKHALANILAGTIFAILSMYISFDEKTISDTFEASIRLSLIVAMVGSFATAAADTGSSEIGQVYGKTPVNPLTFKKVKPGTEGAISLEGTLFGVFASLVVAFVGIVTGLYKSYMPSWMIEQSELAQMIVSHIEFKTGFIAIISVILGAFLGNMLESLIGAAIGKKLNNELLNFLNTLAGGIISGIIMFVLIIRVYMDIPAF